MYDKILGTKFSEARVKLGCFDSVDKVKRVFTLSNTGDFDTCFPDSDVIVIFNVMGDTTPIIVVERVRYSESALKEAYAALERFNNDDYYAEVEDYAGLRDFVDIVLIRRRLYDCLQAGDI